MTVTDDDFVFSDEDAPAAPDVSEPWRVLVIDDEPDIHVVTKLCLRDVVFRGRRLSFSNAYSAAEGEAALRQGTEYAVILLDVVMETEDAGLRLARLIREEIGNRRTRIILRTGEPGQAPERRVILDYDINDYKAKSELTDDKLFVAMIGSLRAYDDIMTIERARRQLDLNRQGLLKIIEATPAIFLAHSIAGLAEGALQQLQALVCPDRETLFAQLNGIAAARHEPDLRVVAGTGRYADAVGRLLSEVLDPAQRAMVEQALAGGRSLVGDEYFVAVVPAEGGRLNLLMVDGLVELSSTDIGLIELFCRQVGLGCELVGRLSTV